MELLRAQRASRRAAPSASSSGAATSSASRWRRCSCRRAAVRRTVTVCHSRTRDLARTRARADILIAAVGQRADDHRRHGEAGRRGDRRRDESRRRSVDADAATRLVGDVDFDGVREVASQITPVPGGVGPMTIAMLLSNTLRAAAGIA